jgi:hypothetical protein
MNVKNVWIITTGSSDVQLTTHKNWNPLCGKASGQLNNNSKKIELNKSVVKPKGGNAPVTRFLAPARAMGIVYGKAIGDRAECYNDLDFPLLNNFSALLRDKNIVFSRIIVLLTDQAHLFTSGEKIQSYCPHWQDTCTLDTVIKRYFQTFSQKESGIEPEFRILKPDTENPDIAVERVPGLDDWNYVLKLVQKEFANLQDLPEDATVYVSHQAGTPAISSAVQFASLARFRTNVKFLVSNEYDRELTRALESSNYLRGIQMLEAQRLLKGYDYAGVKKLLQPYLSLNNDELELRIKSLLAIAVQWNFSEFDDFKKKLEKYEWDKKDIVAERFSHWWWVGYEAAYLAVIRLKQKNTVEALFHSFRAVEGSIAEWAKDTYKDYIDDNGQSLLLKPAILNILPHYLNSNVPSVLKPQVRNKLKDELLAGKLWLYSASLYELLRISKPQWPQNEHISIVWDVAAKRRNQRFHQILGMKELEVCDAWQTNNSQQWEQRVLGCLNFVSDRDFTSLKDASLMAKVHDELVNAIAHYELQK